MPFSIKTPTIVIFERNFVEARYTAWFIKKSPIPLRTIIVSPIVTKRPAVSKKRISSLVMRASYITFVNITAEKSAVPAPSANPNRWAIIKRVFGSIKPSNGNMVRK